MPKSEKCKDYGFCFDSDCEDNETCAIIDCTRDECLCFICMDKPENSPCMCKRCEITKMFGDVCEWKKECFFSSNDSKLMEQKK